MTIQPPQDAYPAIQALVTQFRFLSLVERKELNEAATRQVFVLPLLAALGWRIEDPYEVSPEEKVSRGFPR